MSTHCRASASESPESSAAASAAGLRTLPAVATNRPAPAFRNSERRSSVDGCAPRTLGCLDLCGFPHVLTMQPSRMGAAVVVNRIDLAAFCPEIEAIHVRVHISVRTLAIPFRLDDGSIACAKFTLDRHDDR